MRDVVLGLRSVLRRPVLSAAVVLTLGIGIGANTAIFSMVDGVLLRDLPYPKPERLLRVRTHFRGHVSNSCSEANFRDFREQINSVEAVAAYGYDRLHLGETDEPRYVLAAIASHELFDVLGVQPGLGRGFGIADERPDNPIAVIGHGFWQSHFAGRADVVGQAMTLDGRSYTVVGVMPAEFAFPSGEVELWLPAYFDPARFEARENHYLGVVARLAAGATAAAAKAELRAYGERVVREFPDNYKTFQFGVSAIGLHEHEVGEARTPLLLLLAAVMFVLLIACANVANLLLVRAEARGRELAIRAALGASRARLVRQLLAESLILSCAGGALGLVMALSGTRSLLALAVGAVPRVDNVSVDNRVLLFTAAVSVLAGLLAGLLPALRAGRGDLRSTLLAGGRGLAGLGTRNRTRWLLVTAEVALAVMLIAGAGLMIRSLGELGSVDPGFRTDDVLAIHVALAEQSSEEPERVVAFFSELEEETRALPGVLDVGVAHRVPLLSGLGWWSIQIRDREVETIGEAPTTYVQRASPGYFRALGLNAPAGRLFRRADGPGQPLVAVVNEAFVRELLDDGPAVGRQLSVWYEERYWVEIVGVVQDIRHREIASHAAPMLYLPHAQPGATAGEAARSMWLFVHREPGTTALAASIREIVGRLDASVPVTRVETMEGVRSAAFADREFPTVLLGVFGAIALILAAVGIYGVVAFAAAQRTREIGIRLAIGAVAHDVRRLVVLQSLAPVVLGLVVGLAGFFAGSGLLRSQLFNVAPGDPLTVVAVAVLLLGVAAAAAFIPAVRASRIDPAAVLRNE